MNFLPQASMLTFGNMTGAVIISIPSLLTITVSSLFVPVIDGFQQNA
jgi:hypothetical protein